MNDHGETVSRYTVTNGTYYFYGYDFDEIIDCIGTNTGGFIYDGRRKI